MDLNQKSKKQFRPGANFKNGKLYVFSKGAVTVLRPWPDLRAWRLTIGRRIWRHIRPDINVRRPSVWGSPTPKRERVPYEYPRIEEPEPVMEEDYELDCGEVTFVPPVEPKYPKSYDDWIAQVKAHDDAAFVDYFSTFPLEILALLSPFNWRQWHIAVILSRVPGAADLVRSNPALAFCLASNWMFRMPRPAHPIRDARTWIKRRQRDIAGWLDFPATEQVVNILRKIPAETCHAGLLMFLRAALADQKVRELLSHSQVIDASTLKLVCDTRTRPFMSATFLAEVRAMASASHIVSAQVRILLDAIEMAESLNQKSVLPLFNGLKKMIRVHNEMAAKLNRMQHLDLMAAPIPPPPIPGNEEIIPLTSPSMFLEEGRAQRNCVVNYIRKVSQGKGYIYRVLSPERATLHIVESNQNWFISELSGIENRPVRPQTIQRVEAWLNFNSREGALSVPW